MKYAWELIDKEGSVIESGRCSTIWIGDHEGVHLEGTPTYGKVMDRENYEMRIKELV